MLLLVALCVLVTPGEGVAWAKAVATEVVVGASGKVSAETLVEITMASVRRRCSACGLLKGLFQTVIVLRSTFLTLCLPPLLYRPQYFHNSLLPWQILLYCSESSKSNVIIEPYERVICSLEFTYSAYVGKEARSLLGTHFDDDGSVCEKYVEPFSVGGRWCSFWS